MARPKGTSQYPSDEAVVDKMEKAHDEEGLSPWAAAGKYLKEAEGDSDEGKRRRLTTKLKNRLEARDQMELPPNASPLEILHCELFKALAGLRPRSKARILKSFNAAERELRQAYRYEGFGKAGVTVQQLEDEVQLGILALVRVAIEEAESLKRGDGD